MGKLGPWSSPRDTIPQVPSRKTPPSAQQTPWWKVFPSWSLCLSGLLWSVEQHGEMALLQLRALFHHLGLETLCVYPDSEEPPFTFCCSPLSVDPASQARPEKGSMLPLRVPVFFLIILRPKRKPFLLLL